MRTPHRFILCFALSIACAHASAAQQRRRAPARRTAAPNAPAAGAPRAARTPWTITTQPFREDAENITLVSLQPMPTGAVAGAQLPPLNYGVNFTYEGNTPANFRNVTLSFFSRAKTCRFASEPPVVLNLDNRPLTLPFRPQAKGADGVFWVERDEEGGDCAETVIAYVSPATLARIAAARSVKGTIGREAFQFTANNLGALRALLAQLRLPQLRNAQPARARARR